MASKVCTHLMFEGRAEEAMRFYISLLPNSGIVAIKHYEEGENKGKVLEARFTLAGKEFICIDSPISHDFSFTPAMSVFIDFDSRAELEVCFAQLSAQGTTMMPLDDYGFSDLFAWVSDQFGVSWQLNLPRPLTSH